jgi:hypothetical protein
MNITTNRSDDCPIATNKVVDKYNLTWANNETSRLINNTNELTKFNLTTT